MIFDYLMGTLDFHKCKILKLSNCRDGLIFLSFYSKDLARSFYPEFVSSHFPSLPVLLKGKNGN